MSFSEVRTNAKSNSISLTKDVALICNPLFRKFNINCFSYSRVFSDGSRSELWSDAESLLHTFIEKRYLTKNYTPTNYKKTERYVSLPHKIEEYTGDVKEEYLNLITDQRKIFNHDNCFIIVNKSELLCEYFIFYTPETTKPMINFYFNHLDLLEEFVKLFKDKASKLITKADQNKIVLPWRDKKIVFPEDVSVEKYGSSLRKPIILSRREQQIAFYLIEGKTAAETADLLFLSKRTVESYWERLREKFNCNRKTELLLKLIKHNDLIV